MKNKYILIPVTIINYNEMLCKNLDILKMLNNHHELGAMLIDRMIGFAMESYMLI